MDVMEMIKQHTYFFVVTFSHLPFAPEIIYSEKCYDVAKIAKLVAKRHQILGPKIIVDDDGLSNAAQFKVRDCTVTVKRINNKVDFYNLDE